jgi:hypothetical protein
MSLPFGDEDTKAAETSTFGSSGMGFLVFEFEDACLAPIVPAALKGEAVKDLKRRLADRLTDDESIVD